MQSIHFDFTLECLVRKEFLFDLTSGFGEFFKAKVFGISSYPGHLLTFNLLIEDKYIYSYIPVHALTTKEATPLSQENSCYFPCPSGELTVHNFTGLRKACHIFNRDSSFRCLGTYLNTFDWYQDNDLCHLIEQTDGNLILWPSHKLVFSDDKQVSLPKFKKLHTEWKFK